MNLKEYRKSLGLTQELAGDKIGLTKQRWGQLEKNWPNLAVDTVIHIVQAFDTPVSITPNGGVRFLNSDEIAELNKPLTQEELNENIDNHLFNEG